MSSSSTTTTTISSSHVHDENVKSNSNNNDDDSIIRFQSPLQQQQQQQRYDEEVVLSENNNHLTNTNNDDLTTALIILNTPISTPPNPIFQRLWDISCIRICADGGANRLYDATAGSLEYVPDYIKGDLDSLRNDVKQYYDTLGQTQIIRDPCQDTNDFDKALQTCLIEIKNTTTNTGDDDDDDDETSSTTSSGAATSIADGSNSSTTSKNKYDRIVVYGAFGGRFDQEMASIQALYNWGPILNYQLYLYTDETCAWLVPGSNKKCQISLPFYGNFKPTTTTINNNKDKTTTTTTTTTTSNTTTTLIGEGPTCGLIPMGCKVDSIKTSGFKWDLDGTVPLQFGGLVSTSNHLEKSIVSIESSHPVVFTAEVSIIKPTTTNNNDDDIPSSPQQ